MLYLYNQTSQVTVVRTPIVTRYILYKITGIHEEYFNKINVYYVRLKIIV